MSKPTLVGEIDRVLTPVSGCYHDHSTLRDLLRRARDEIVRLSSFSSFQSGVAERSIERIAALESQLARVKPVIEAARAARALGIDTVDGKIRKAIRALESQLTLLLRS